MTNRLTHCQTCRRMAWHAEKECLLCESPDIETVPDFPPDYTDRLDILRRYQAWRRGHDERPLPDTGLENAAIGLAIDAGIDALEQQLTGDEK